MPVYTDQTGRTVTITTNPKRIISLVPSQTELLADLGLENEVAGITKFCVHPENWFRTKTRVGGTKQIRMDDIHQLKPDLIIANKEENVKEQVEELEKQYPVWVSDVSNLSDAVQMMEQTGNIINRKKEALVLTHSIKKRFDQLPTPKTRLQAVYLIWQNPYMTVGGDTFINAMIEAAGFNNLYAGTTRYPEITIEELKEQKPDIIFLSSEPFPFKQKHAEELQTYLPGSKIIFVDGEMFSWYGSRLLYAPDYFIDLYKNIK